LTDPFESEEGQFLVLVNDEDQYALWPAFLDVPAGWAPTGPAGERETCLRWIETTWKDMRPRSLREAQSTSGST